MITLETKIYDKYQTVIPSEIRKKLNLSPSDIVEWSLMDDGSVSLNFRKKMSLDDIIGIIETKEPTNAVKLKKMASRGEKIPRS